MRSLLTLLLAFCATAIYAQTGNISGVVMTSDHQPADFVSVALKGTSKGTTTDKNGAFIIKNINPGSHIVAVPMVGLKAIEQTVEVKAGETTTIDITLSESSQKLQEVVVTSNTGRYTDNTPSSSLRVMTQIQELPQNIQVVTAGMLKDQPHFGDVC